MELSSLLLIFICFLVGGAGGMLVLKLIEASIEGLLNLMEKKVKVKYETLKDYYDDNIRIEGRAKELQEKNELLLKRLKVIEESLFQQYQEV